MRVAVISDIHGNLQALEAILEDIKDWSPDLLLVGGDIVLRGPDSLQVLECLSTIDHIAIAGNADDIVANVSETTSPNENPVMALARFTKEQIGPKWVAYLSSLPDHRYISIHGTDDVCLAHGIPGDCYRGIVWSDEQENQLLSESTWPDKFVHPKELKSLLRKTSAKLFLTAHTHRQFQRYVEGVTVINPGTVGGQHIFRSSQMMAEYAICHLSKKLGLWTVIFRQIPFDVKITLARLKALKKKCEAVDGSIDFYKRKKDSLWS